MGFHPVCPHCGKTSPLEAAESNIGREVTCPDCGQQFAIQKPVPKATPPIEQPSGYSSPPSGFPSRSNPDRPISSRAPDAATERQLSYIRALKGAPPPGLTKEEASALIEDLRNTAPPTEKQLQILKKMGAAVPAGLTSAQASYLISELNGNQPPTKQQIKYIKMLGGEVPATKQEASQLCDSLPHTAPASPKQRKQADGLGVSLPESVTFSQANELLGNAEMDADPEEGKPPSQAQLSKIAKLGGDPQKASNRWRADEYIDELEEKAEQFQDRVDEALEWMFGDADSRSVMSVKKPSKAVMKNAILFGESQGWGEGWEDPGGDSDLNAYSLMDFAIYSVAPELLKSRESPPRMPTRDRGVSAKGKGCLLVAAAVLIVPLMIWWLST